MGIFPPIKTEEEIQKMIEESRKEKAKQEAMTPEKLKAYYAELRKKRPPIRILDNLED